MAEIEYDIFLSHNQAQKNWTRNLAVRLSNAGFHVWLDEWCIRPGENAQLAIEQGILKSDRVALILSPEAVKSEWVIFEQLTTTLPDPNNRSRTLIPLYRITCEIPRRIAGFKFIDFRRDEDFDKAFAALTRELRQEPPDSSEANKRLGDLPAVFAMPHLPNPNFVGREKEIKQLHTLLAQGTTVTIGQVASATGLGGIGKTQLAITYAYRYGGHYPGGVFWIDADNPSTISEQVAAFGGPMLIDLPEFTRIDLQTKVAKVRAFWKRASCLIIFDNVLDPEVIRDWFPQGRGCRVLVTTRMSDWPSWLDIRTVQISPLPRKEAIELLLRGLPRGTGQKKKELTATANEICEVLGDLPLAIDLAGKYLSIYKDAISPKKYLEDLKANPVLTNPALVGDVDDPSPTEHLRNVAATFGMSWEKLDAHDTTDAIAMRLFHLASFFAPHSINRDLLMKSNEMDVHLEKDKIRATKAFRRLASLGLLTIEEAGRLLQHRLLAAFAETRHGPEQIPGKSLEAVCQAVFEFAQNANESLAVSDLGKEMPHLRHLADEAEEQQLLPLASLLQLELGYHVHLQASYDEAREHLGRALDLAEAHFGWTHLLSPTLRKIAGILHVEGLIEDALELFNESLRLNAIAFGDEDPEVASDHNQIGLVQRSQGEYNKAIKRFRIAIRIYEKRYGKRHPKVGSSLNNIGVCFQEKGELDKALRYFNKALEIDESLPDNDAFVVGRDLNNIANLLHDQGNPERALEYHNRALTVIETAFGKDHPHVTQHLENIGDTLLAESDFDGALEHFRRCLLIEAKVFGRKHPSVAFTLDKIGRAQRGKKDLNGALESYLEALAIFRSVFGEDDQTVRTMLYRIVAVRDELDPEGQGLRPGQRRRSS
jgi:tetratricopeptide (TPR) repeat protein